MLTTELIDISPLISENLAVFPGDTAFSRKINMDFKNNEHLLLSEMTTTMHLGAHTDAPNHYHADGESIDERSLDYYYGQCQVIEVNIKKGEVIKVSDIEEDITTTRVLFKTKSYPNPNVFNTDFNGISPDVIKFLAAKKVKLVGIDTPSVDPADSKELSCHKEIYHNNMAILEGIVLDKVSPGVYTLSAFPLKIKGSDAAPTRAVLIRNNNENH